MTDAVGPADRLLGIDTATSRLVVAVGDRAGGILAAQTTEAGHRHGEDLLPAVRDVLATAGAPLGSLVAIVVGTGPGAFTGMRVGIATAKALASALDIPIVGVSTAAALLAASGRSSRAALLLPAVPSDRILVRDDVAEQLRGVDDAALADVDLVAVDLDGRAPDDAIARGTVALGGLAAALLRLGAERLARGETDDISRLVPEYVSLPRGVRTSSGEVAWSRGRR